MAVTIDAVKVFSGSEVTAIAPVIEGATPTGFLNRGDTNGVGFTQSTNFLGRLGCRIALPSATNFTTHKFIAFGLYNESGSVINNTETLANGGIRLVFVDNLGNYAGFNIWGFDVPKSPVSPPNADGSFATFRGLSGTDAPNYFLSWERTPDISSVTPVNFTNITHVELSLAYRISSAGNLSIAGLTKHSGFIATGTENLKTCVAVTEVFNASGANRHPRLFRRLPWFQDTGAQNGYYSQIGARIGNGTTATTFSDQFFSIGMFNTIDQWPTFNTPGNDVILNDQKTGRGIYINQSATDAVTLTDGSIASAAWWEWEVTGSTSGTVTCTRVQFWRYSKFVAGHGQYIDCQFNGASAPVEVNGTSVILDGVIRDAATTALKVNTGPAIYDDLSLRFNNPTATADIELGSGGAGTYELPNIEVPAGYTLKIRNNSATNAITVAIPTGITFSTSTAGGTINVITPSVTATGQITGIFAGSRLQVFNQTTNTEVFNGIVSGTGYSNTYVEGSTFSNGDIVRIRLAYQAGTTAKVPVQYRTVATAAGWSILADQQNDTVYIQNAIDGDTVTEFIEDFPNVQIDVNDPDGVTTVQRGYAWYISGQMTADGLRFFHGGMVAEDDVNYRINADIVNMTIQNINANPLRVIGGRLYRSDGSTAIAPGGGGVQMDYGRAYAVETGVSGLTPAESDRLMQTALQTTAQDAARNAALAAALSA